MRNKKIYITRFDCHDTGNGGDRRSYQIKEHFGVDTVISLKDITVPSLRLRHALSTWGRLKVYLKWRSLQRSGYASCWDTNYQLSYLIYVLKAWLLTKRWDENELNEVETCYVDDPVYLYPVVDELKKRGIKVYGVIHNLESLAGGQAQKNKQTQLLKAELDQIKKCDEVITIAAEEDLLLTNLHIKSEYLPYEPSVNVKEQMELIRKQREKTRQEGLLMIGTVNNAPTRLGMLAFKRLYMDQHFKEKYGTLTIGGFGMHQHADKFKGEGIKVLERISDEQMIQLYCSCKAFVCYQLTGSGALTKLPELAIADVPVLGNRVALRGGYTFSNTHLIE